MGWLGGHVVSSLGATAVKSGGCPARPPDRASGRLEVGSFQDSPRDTIPGLRWSEARSTGFGSQKDGVRVSVVRSTECGFFGGQKHGVPGFGGQKHGVRVSVIRSTEYRVSVVRSTEYGFRWSEARSTGFRWSEARSMGFIRWVDGKGSKAEVVAASGIGTAGSSWAAASISRIRLSTPWARL